MKRRKDRWFRVEVNGVAVVHVLGWKEAQGEARAARRANPGARVRVVEETP